MHLRRNRIRRHRHGDLHLHPLAIVGICLLAAVLLTVIAGNLLKLWLDDETFRRLTEGEDTPEDETPIYNSYLRDIRAYPYTFGGDTEVIWEYPEISVNLNSPDGTLAYSSPVSEWLGVSSPDAPPLGESMGTVSAVASYISGVYYTGAFSEPTGDLRYAATTRDCALLREFIKAGGHEVLLRGLPVVAASPEDLVAYLRAVKAAFPEAPVGVSVPLALMQDPKAGQTLEKLLTVCDFLALDLTTADVESEEEAASLLDACRFPLKAYDMRLLLREGDAYLAAAAESLTDVQLIGALPLASSPDHAPE